MSVVSAHAISYGTRVWLADLLAGGWEASVVHHSPVERHYHLRLVDDLEEQVQTVTQPARIGVLCMKGTSGIFIACTDADDARSLLDSATREAGDL